MQPVDDALLRKTELNSALADLGYARVGDGGFGLCGDEDSRMLGFYMSTEFTAVECLNLAKWNKEAFFLQPEAEHLQNAQLG